MWFRAALLVTVWLTGPLVVLGPAPGEVRRPSPLLLPLEIDYLHAHAPVAAAAPTPAPQPGAPPVVAVTTDSAAAQLEAMEDAYRRVRDYTAMLSKQERVKGKLLPRETIHVKFRKPYSLYMKWSGAVKPGQEVLYIRGKNDGKLRAHPGSFPDVTVSLAPRSALAMKGNRHPITDASLGDVLRLMVGALRRSQERPQDAVTMTDLGEETRHGARVRCIDARFPADGYYAPHVRLCSFVTNKMLARIQVWDANEQLLEDYEYRDLRINVGLRDQDFAEDNPAYNF